MFHLACCLKRCRVLMSEALESRRMLVAVTGLVLINADTNKMFAHAPDGAVINLAITPTRRLNMRANVTTDTTKVTFDLDGKQIYRTENTRPFAMAGDDSGDYRNWTPDSGVHKLTVIATGANGSFSKRSLLFTVTDDEPTTKPSPPPVAGEWELKLNEGFDGELDSDRWSRRFWWNGNVSGKDELQVYQNDAVTVANGTLRITATKDSTKATDGTVRPYKSGILTTGGIKDRTPPSFAFKYGYIEARIQVPSGKGIWPAFWMLPASHKDGNGEIDVMEVIGDRPATLETHYHVHGRDIGRSTKTETKLSDGFHKYGVLWEQDAITWYLDGKQVFRTSGDNIVAEPMYLLMNLAVGGHWPGPPDENTKFPATLQVDYVRVWQRPQ